LVPPPAVNHGYDTNSDINVYVHPDTMARFPGSIKKYFADSIRYPEDAKEKRIQGTVFLNVIIERDGSISNINILRTPDSILNQEAIRVVSTMPKWIPGKQNGKTVRVQKVMPIRFDLPTTSADSAIKK
jgi:periplasmic protein TonB